MNNGFLRVFYTEWRKFFSNPKKMFWVLAMPLLIFLFFGNLLKTGVPHDMPIAVIDYDQSSLSRNLIQDIEATATMQISNVVETMSQAEKLLQRGDVYAFVLIPQNFEKQIYRGEGSEAICYTNNQFMLPSGLIQKSFLETVGEFSAHLNVGKRMKKGQYIQAALADIQNVRVDSHVLYNPYTNYSYYLNLAIIPMMFQVLIVIISIYVLGLVLKRGKGKKLYKLGNHSVFNVVLGKLLPYTILFVLMAWVMDIYLFDYIGIPSNAKNGEIFMILFLFILVCQSIAIFFVAFSPNLRSALTYGGGYSALAFSFSGYTFPMDGLPTLMQWVAKVFPFTHFLDSYVNISIRNFHMSHSLNSLLALSAFMGLGIVALPQLAKRLKKGGYEKAI